MESQLRFEATIARLPIYIFRSDCSSRNFRRQDPGFQSCRNSLVRAWVFEGDLSCLLLRSAVGAFRRRVSWGLFWWLGGYGLLVLSGSHIEEYWSSTNIWSFLARENNSTKLYASRWESRGNPCASQPTMSLRDFVWGLV